MFACLIRKEFARRVFESVGEERQVLLDASILKKEFGLMLRYLQLIGKFVFPNEQTFENYSIIEGVKMITFV